MFVPGPGGLGGATGADAIVVGLVVGLAAVDTADEVTATVATVADGLIATGTVVDVADIAGVVVVTGPARVAVVDAGAVDVVTELVTTCPGPPSTPMSDGS